MEHTPLKIEIEYPNKLIIDKKVLTKDDADFIVRACGAHEDLLEACKGAMRILPLWEAKGMTEENKGEMEALVNMRYNIEKAIQKAGGK